MEEAYEKLRHEYIESKITEAHEAVETEYAELREQRDMLVKYFEEISHDLTGSKVVTGDPMGGWMGARGWNRGIKFAAVPGTREPLSHATVAARQKNEE